MGFWQGKLIKKSIKEWQSYGPDMKKRPYFLPLTSKCDLDLGAIMGQHCFQVFSKSTEKWQSYGPDIKKKRPYF